MKSLVVYSSVTGNTKKVAETIYNQIPLEKDIYKSDEKFDYNKYDLIVIGYWVDKGTCDNNTIKLIEKIHNKNILLFGTLGAEDVGDYYDSIKQKVEEIIDKDNKILGHFLCQGKINDKLVERYKEMLKENPNNIKIREQIKIYERASTHPDSRDMNNAKEFIKKYITTL
ncbi:flavodoxin family protein BilS [Clostridium oceanicum]|uniref:Flavodoxin family protein n=1 Tax=Clostridium oceanicum TaxID=1543 RepID=A0ABP3UPK6_9CLOT